MERVERGGGGNGEEDLFVREFVERARFDLLNVAGRILEIVVRYFQYRVREVGARGITLDYTTRVSYGENSVKLIIEVFVPEELIRRYAERYGELARIVRMIMRRATVVDRYITRARDVEDMMEGVEVDLESGGESGGGER